MDTDPGPVVETFLGVDVGSVTTKAVLLRADPGGDPWSLLGQCCLPTAGRPLESLQQAIRAASGADGALRVLAAAATGSGRVLAGTVIGADLVKNEVTAHAVAALALEPEVQTVIEIGGQDSKLIILRHGVVVDFAMNTVCAAGTGSFLDRQAARLGVPVEEFGRLASASGHAVRIAGRCAVFAESDMVHKQQVGHSVPDVVRGLCQALVRNYLNNLAKGKEILPPVVFQGGVAANQGIVEAFEETLGTPLRVPAEHCLMGAIGAALLAREAHALGRIPRTAFRGLDVATRALAARGFECDGCPNRCEVVELSIEGLVVARWGGRCGRWELAAS